ncbi:MAG: hypothetical protein ACK5N8_04805 [Alphaproteobacteria bacterium]
MKTKAIVIRKPIKSRKVSSELTFKELAFVYEHLKDGYGKVNLQEIGEEKIFQSKLSVESFAEFAKIVKSSNNEYRVSKK